MNAFFFYGFKMDVSFFSFFSTNKQSKTEIKKSSRSKIIFGSQKRKAEQTTMNAKINTERERERMDMFRCV